MKRWLGYILFCLSAVILFLYLLFPAKSVKDYIAYQIRQIDPQLRMTAQDPFLRIPPGIKLHDIDIRFDQTPLVRLESLSIFPRVMTFFKSTRNFRFRGRAYKGESIGALLTDGEGKWQIQGTGDGFQAQLIPMASTTHGSLSGTIAGDYEITATQGLINSTISDGTFSFNEPFLEVRAIDFAQILLELEFEQGRMQIKKAKMMGSQIDGDVAGQVIIRQPISDSIVDVSGLIKPHPLFLAELRKKVPPGFLSDQIVKKGFKFSITGTVKEPELSF